MLYKHKYYIIEAGILCVYRRLLDVRISACGFVSSTKRSKEHQVTFNKYIYIYIF